MPRSRSSVPGANSLLAGIGCSPRCRSRSAIVSAAAVTPPWRGSSSRSPLGLLSLVFCFCCLHGVRPPHPTLCLQQRAERPRAQADARGRARSAGVLDVLPRLAADHHCHGDCAFITLETPTQNIERRYYGTPYTGQAPPHASIACASCTRHIQPDNTASVVRAMACGTRSPVSEERSTGAGVSFASPAWRRTFCGLL